MEFSRAKWKCKQCGQYFSRRSYRGGFCSHQCSSRYRKGKPHPMIRKVNIPDYKNKICKNCGEMYKPTSGTQIYCGKCKFHCFFCGKETSGASFCRSCWQKGRRNNSKRKDVRRKLRIAARNRDWNEMKGRRPSKETREKMSKAHKGNKNPMFGKVTYGTGYCRWYDYFSPIAGMVRLQGTYELRMAKVLDRMKWKWSKTKDHFIYDNGNHAYIPDFKVIEREGEKCLFYIDTKGWFPVQEQIKIAKVRKENFIILLLIDVNMLNEYERRVA